MINEEKAMKIEGISTNEVFGDNVLLYANKDLFRQISEYYKASDPKRNKMKMRAAKQQFVNRHAANYVVNGNYERNMQTTVNARKYKQVPPRFQSSTNDRHLADSNHIYQNNSNQSKWRRAVY